MMDIEKKIIEYLREKLTTDKVYGEEPDSPEGEFFVVDKTGSSTTDRLFTSTVAIKSYADTKSKASALNEELKTAMLDIVSESGVSSCRLVSDYNFTNTAKKQRRYQAVFNLTHH